MKFYDNIYILGLIEKVSSLIEMLEAAGRSYLIEIRPQWIIPLSL